MQEKEELEQQEQHEKLINVNLFRPGILPKGYTPGDEDPVPELKLPPHLVIPPFKEVADYKEVPEDVSKMDSAFVKQFRTGLIVFDKPDEFASPVRGSETTGSVKPLVHRHVFEEAVWSPEEELLFKELLCAFGCNWSKISSLMHSKKPFQLEEYYVNNRYDLTCQLCGGTDDDSKLLLCDGCDRAYHIYCLDPPLKAVPQKASWYCTKECESISKTVRTLIFFCFFIACCFKSAAV